MGIIKADAYGHGLEAIVNTLAPDVEMFGVASLAEAMQVGQVLGEADKDIFLLGAVLPCEQNLVVENGLITAITNLEEATALGRIAAEKNTLARVHVAIDTGMGRIGADANKLEDLLHQLTRIDHLSVEGLYSHFPSADESDQNFTLQQIEHFKNAAILFRKHFPDAIHIHIANSAGVLRFTEQLNFTTLARPGLALYGVAPGDFGQQHLKPAMTLKTEIALIRELPPGHSISYGRTFITEREPVTRVATLAAGYGDGYPRQLSGTAAEVLIGGQRCPVLGTVTMDQIMVDVSALTPAAKPADEAVLLGRQGSEEISATEIADKAGTIAWHVFTGINNRVSRIYG